MRESRPASSSARNFVSTDIDEFKAVALALRLQAIDSTVSVEASTADAHGLFGDDTAAPDTDLIIDATANMALAERIERHRRTGTGCPPLITMLVGFRATRGLALVAPRGYPGTGVDLLRKAKIAVSTTERLRSFADDFFPDPPRAEYFQPEPGCSEATFTGSNGQMAALAGTLLLHAHGHLGDASASVTMFDLGLDADPHLETLPLKPDTIVERAGYTVGDCPWRDPRMASRGAADGTPPGTKRGDRRSPARRDRRRLPPDMGFEGNRAATRQPRRRQRVCLRRRGGRQPGRPP